MDIEIILLILIVIFVAAAFALSFLRLWFVTHYDADLGNKVKGLRMSFAKLTKDVKAQYEQSSNDLRDMEVDDAKQQLGDLSSIDLSNMTLEQAAESIGIDPEQLNNPLFRPMAEKVFEQIKAKAKGGTDVGGTGTEDGY